MAPTPKPLDPMEEDAPPSKTRRKQESHALQDLGEELVALSPEHLQKIEAPSALIEAVHEARRISKFGALRRQMQYIGRLMRDVDVEPIRAQLDGWKGRSAEDTARLHRIERWRTRLLGDETALGELIAAYPQADAQRVRTLVRNAQREAAAQKPPKSFRELFQALREIIEDR
jgi:ribosome-associated protein